MNTHLSPDELVTALDGALDATREEHLRTCTVCRADFARLEETMKGIGAEVPEPSPLFWDHLSERIRVAVAAEPIPRPVSWWASGWVRAAGIGAVAAAAALVMTLRVPPAATDVPQAAPVVADSVPVSDDDSWGDIEQIASRLSADDVHAVIAAAPEMAPTVGELSAKQREAFVRLLGSELNGDMK